MSLRFPRLVGRSMFSANAAPAISSRRARAFATAAVLAAVSIGQSSAKADIIVGPSEPGYTVPPVSYAYNSGSGQFTYTYDSGSGTSDANASTPGSTYGTDGLGDYYYQATSSPGTGTVSYTFTASPGYEFEGNASITQQSLVASFNEGTSTSNIVGSVSLDGGSLTPFYTFAPESESNPQFEYTDYTATSFSVAGATTFDVSYSLNNNESNYPQFVQVFRGNGNSNPVIVTGTLAAVPEPASLALCTIGALGLLRRRRSAMPGNR